MSDSLRDLVLAHIPEDGSAIGNGALIARLREIVPNLSDEDYAAAKDALVDEGILGKGKGRGGSVYLITDDSDDDKDQDDDFELTPTDEPAPKAKRAAAKAKAAPRKSGEPAQVISYRHTDTRVNNPEVGMVHPDNDPDQPKTVWAYDPHLDPALMFDSQRARVEKLIDDALASDDPDRYALGVCNQILGGGLSSRLFQEIREERGLAYTVFSSVAAFSDAGSLAAYVGTGAERVDEVRKLLLEITAELAADGVTEREWEVALGYLEGSFILGLEDSGSVMARLGNHVCSRGEVVPVDQQLAKLRAVTRDQVVSVARRVLAHPPTICGVGPLTDADLGA